LIVFISGGSMSKPRFRYDVFLSHNSKDKAAVETLAVRLEDEAGLKVFLDRWNLVAGDPWQEDLEKALAQSRTVAVFLGPSGIGGWHNEEMRAALEQRVRDPQRRVIPVLLPGTTMPGPDAIPAFLARLTWCDFRPGLQDEVAFRGLAAGIRGQPPGRGVKTSAPGPGIPEAAESHPEPEPGSRNRRGPTIFGNFQGNLIEGDQVIIHKLEDRSIHVNAPVTNSLLVSGENNRVKFDILSSREDFSDLLEQMRSLLDQASLSPEEQVTALPALEQALVEAEKPQPNRSKVLEHLQNLVEFLANSATIAATTPQLIEMGRRAIEWVEKLF
jgi:hypothetical protein